MASPRPRHRGEDLVRGTTPFHFFLSEMAEPFSLRRSRHCDQYTLLSSCTPGAHRRDHVERPTWRSSPSCTEVDMAEDERAGRGLPGPGGDRCPGRGSFRETRGACRALITPLFLSALSISLFSRSFSYPVSSLPGEWNDTSGNCSPAEGLRCFRALLQGGLSAPRSAGATSRNRGPCARGDPRVIRSRRSCPSPAHR